jgi:hypothetical protein
MMLEPIGGIVVSTPRAMTLAVLLAGERAFHDKDER